MNKLQEPQNKGSQAQEKPTFIMLAAGNSRRFGSNKLLYEIGGVPMYLRTLHKLQKAASELGNCEIIVVTQYTRIRSPGSDQFTPGTWHFLIHADRPSRCKRIGRLPFYRI